VIAQSGLVLRSPQLADKLRPIRGVSPTVLETRLRVLTTATVMAIYQHSMWVLFAQTLNPIAAKGRAIVGEQ
jgi:hypothetical protein